MTNYDKWLLLTKNLTSPNSFITFGFYQLISIALQRRVWYYDQGHMPLYCNQYTVFVAPPAIGKGLILGLVKELAKAHKYEKGHLVKTSVGMELPPLFPVGADYTTYEDLMRNVARCYRTVRPEGAKAAYGHCSYAFILEELSSLFRRQAEHVIKFLLNAYDCKDYDYSTKHQGEDLLRKLCLNFLAGTQLDFLKDAHKTGVFGQGFSSRTLFLFESKRRFESFHISAALSPEQERAKADLLVWLKQLGGLVGEITYPQEAAEWLEDWYVNTHVPAEYKASTKMKDFLGRKRVLLLKLSAAMHFAESTSMTIQLDTFKKALALINSVEPQMEAGLSLLGKNELHTAALQMKEHILLNPGTSKADLILRFGSELSIEQIEICLKELEMGYGLRETLNNGKKSYKI